jgi:hypothetical protein
MQDVPLSKKLKLNEHLWALNCYHDSVGAGWDVVEEYISAHNTYEHNRK